MIVQYATFSKSLNHRNIDKTVSDIRIRIRFPFESSLWISVSGGKLIILPDIQPENHIVIISVVQTLIFLFRIQSRSANFQSESTLDPVSTWHKQQRWSRSRSAGVDSGRSQRFLPKLEQDPESEFWMKTGPGAGVGVRILVFTGVGQLIL